MAVRKRKKTATKKTRKAVKKSPRKAVKKKKRTSKTKISAVQSQAYNRKALWKAYRDLQSRAEKAWEKFHADAKRNAPREVLLRDRNQLLLMLAECDYMARECMRIANKNN